MSDTTRIEWTDATWNPVRGCSRVSEGCRNCYAERLAATRLAHTPAYQDLATMTPEGPRWTGRVVFDTVALQQPLRWRKPRRVFVNSMSDLFHEGLTNEQIAAVFGVMAACPQHTFQVLTKRPERMRDWFRWVAEQKPTVLAAIGNCTFWRLPAEPQRMIVSGAAWPLPNVWLGVSVEDQATADARIPLLLETPAAVRFVSAEPLLGPVDLEPFLQFPPFHENYKMTMGATEWQGLDWVIVGGESGRGVRPMHPNWARNLRDLCAEAGVVFYFKQFGEWAPFRFQQGDEPTMRVLPGGTEVWRLGKGAAGRLLDGREHNEFPGQGGGRA